MSVMDDNSKQLTCLPIEPDTSTRLGPILPESLEQSTLSAMLSRLGDIYTYTPGNMSETSYMRWSLGDEPTILLIQLPRFTHSTSKNTTKISFLEVLVFEHSDFHLSAHDSLRIDALTNGFVEQGRLTKEPARERHWLGVTLVKRMIDAVFENAFRNGFRNWDVTIHNALSLL